MKYAILKHILFMTKIKKIAIYSLIFLAAAAGLFIYGTKKQASAASCYSPFQRIDLEEVYNDSVCQGNFQVYYFPVVTDGRKYTITLHTISGEQKLYASRYKDDVAKLSNVLSWYCYGPHCDSSTEANAETRFVTFQSPAGDPDYYSWFAVYGATESRYQIGLSNNGLKQFAPATSYVPPQPPPPAPPAAVLPVNDTGELPAVSWEALAPENNFSVYDSSWTGANYTDGGWQNISLPDSGWNCDNCYRRYRGTFDLNDLSHTIKAYFESDDGLWLYVNGAYAGHWGANPGQLRCVNHFFGCDVNDSVHDISLTNLQQGKNVISAVVYDGGWGEYFKFELK